MRKVFAEINFDKVLRRSSPAEILYERIYTARRDRFTAVDSLVVVVYGFLLLFTMLNTTTRESTLLGALYRV